ncbi:hypothetical protein ASPSYDRAFT_41791 [Aspergillus sydowii CBS 593.65]|uniref:Uncharacterized protein n=1 Tax=Aspergillus sydowii CBS 593.65 TaxID=1036612 RepID=A0A1L9TUL9_9EURO|nr:uncharacterized protein ASPSYDRAFT_41791 [Aspergillus sydowii CBS 593.65]OJJ63075.1 hypothetical protein ASPSYDRAFT_41791 [Aspergillus sydowii CBS 593.65]
MSDQEKRGRSDDSSRPKSNAERKPNNNSDNTPTGSDNDNQNSQSLASRIQNSASGLARNAFLSSAPSGDTAHLLSDGSKATPSSSSSALAAAEHYGETTGPSSSSSRDKPFHRPAETFRSSSTTQSGGFEIPTLTEDEFQNTYGGDLSGTVDDFEKGKGKGKGRGLDLGQDFTSYHDDTTATPTLVPSDGEAVVSILSDQTFDPDFPPTANEPPEYLETELLPSHLTPDEVRMIESFRRQLPESTSAQDNTGQSRQLNPLSLVPDIGSFLDTVPTHSATDLSTSQATSLRDTVLTSMPGAADWISVEDKYHDEVWGYLRPTLEAAAEEIESSKDTSRTEDGPAVRRLKMILSHMQH